MRKIRDTSVCVAGGAGFLGSHLVDHLIEERNCDVVVLDNLCAGRREFVHPKATFVHCDITKSEGFLRQVMEKHRCRFALNYAAHPYIPDSFARPHHVFETNANGAIQFINAAQEAGCEGILQVSSAEIYGDAGSVQHAIMKGDFNCPDSCEHVGYTESEPVKLSEHSRVMPHSTYGAAKAAVDYYCQTAWRERKTPVIALRQFNCVGERETHPYVVPEIVSQLSRCEKAVKAGGDIGFVKLGNNSFRDFQYAGDAVRMAVELLEKGQLGDVYNMGSESGVKIYDLATMIGNVVGFSGVNVVEDESRKRPWEIWHLQSDNSKLYATGVTKRVTPLEESLRRTVAWFNENGRRWPWEVKRWRA